MGEVLLHRHFHVPSLVLAAVIGSVDGVQRLTSPPAAESGVA